MTSPSIWGLTYVQKQVEQFMVDTVTITRPTAGSFDANTGRHTTGTLSTIYTGKARLAPTRGPREMALGEEIVAMRDTDCYIPIGSPAPRRDDLITVNTSRDPQNVGRVFRITDVRVGSYTASRQLSAVQMEPSETWQP